MNELRTFLLGRSPLIAFIVAASILASLLEGFGLSLVIPLFEGVKGGVSGAIPFPLNQVSLALNNLPLTSRIWMVAGLMVAATFLKGVMIFLSNSSTYRLQMMVVKHYRMRCFEQLMNVGMSYIHSQKNAHLQTIAITHTKNLGALINIAGTLIPKFFSIVILVVMLALLSWKMTVLSFVLIGLASMILRKVVSRAEVAGKNLTKTDKDINNAMLDAILGMKVIRLFSREKDMARKFEGEVDRLNQSYFNLIKIHGSVQPIFETTGVASLAIILIVGSLLLSKGEGAGLEVLLTFILIFFRILSPAMSINQARVAIAGDLPYYREVHRFLEAEGKPYVHNGTRLFQGFRDAIYFRDVDFQYRSDTPVVLRDLNFKIPKGAKVGIVGPSGAGKTTVGELLLRFYDPSRGELLVDGINLKEFDVYSWRRCIGVVSQDIFLFNDTVRANIAFARPEASDEDVKRAARRAHAHEFIEALPKGYDTIIGDRGVLLSGGQRQRIAIARAILTDPEILLLDEATSSLDTESEGIVQRALDEVGEGKTVVTIAHRLSTVTDSDLIIVFENGRMVQQGTHQRLLEEAGGLYRKLVSMQTLEAQESVYPSERKTG